MENWPVPTGEEHLPSQQHQNQGPSRGISTRWKILSVLLLVVCILGGIFLLAQNWFASSPSNSPMAAGTPLARPWCAAPNALSTSFAGFGLSGHSANDVWSVGAGITHWNGERWSVVFRPPSAQTVLRSIVEITPNDIWVVGESLTNGLASHPFTAHSNGNTWSIISTPDAVAGGKNALVAVAGSSSSDVWAVGFVVPPQGALRSLIEHWNGKQWSVVNHPVGPNGSQFTAVKALSPTDVWAVGYGAVLSAGKSISQPEIEHWNGKQWSIVAGPDLTPSGGGALYAIDGSAADNLWAVGSASNRLLSEHWDGQHWSVVSTPAVPPDSSNWLSSVVVSTSGSVWTVGRVRDGANSFRPFIGHWDGHQWQVLQDASDSAGELDLITPIGGQFWIVGIPRAAGGHAFIQVLCP